MAKKKLRLRGGYNFENPYLLGDNRQVCDRSATLQGVECPELIVEEGDANWKAANEQIQKFEEWIDEAVIPESKPVAPKPPAAPKPPPKGTSPQTVKPETTLAPNKGKR